MGSYRIITDSTTDLTPALIEELEVQVVPLCYMMGGRTYHNIPGGGEMDEPAFYNKLRGGAVSTTTQVNSEEFLQVFTPLLEAGEDVLYIAFSSGLSGTYQSALLTGCKNFSRVRPLEDGRGEALDWGAVLTCASPLPPDIRWIGIRPHFVRPADAPGENIILCRVVQAIDDVTDTIVTCATPGPGGPDSLLHLRFKPPQWEVIRGKEELLLYFDPQAILPLRGQGLGPTLSKRPE